MHSLGSWDATLFDLLMYQHLLCHVIYSSLGSRMSPLLLLAGVYSSLINRMSHFMHQSWP